MTTANAIKSSLELSSPSNKNKLIFKWVDHTNTVSIKQRTFYENNEFLDVSILAGTDSVKIQAHKIVVSASSEYFLAAFRSTNLTELIITEIDATTMRSIIDFMYTATIELSLESVTNVLKAAKYLQIKTLIDACCDFMGEQLDASNCLGIALFAEQHNYVELYKKASLFAYKHFDKVSTEKEFAQLTEEQLIKFLSCDDFVPPSEENVCQSLVTWAEYDQDNREKLIFNLLSNVWFVFLKRRFTIETQCSITKTIKCYKLFCSWLHSRLLPKSSSQFLVFVAGRTGTDLKIQIFNRLLNSWSFEKVPDLPKDKKDYRTIIINKKLIIVGGRFEDTNSVECLDLETKEWTELPPMKHKRYGHGVAELNGDLYVIGGRQKNAENIRSVEKYNFSSCEWQDVKPLNFSIDPLISTAVLDGCLYVVDNGHDVMECYDPIKDQWTGKKFKNERLQWFGFAAVGAHLYAVGGNWNKKKSATVERYLPSTDSWTVVSPLKVAMSNVRCTSFNNRLIVCGGDNGSNWVDTVEEYNPATDEWKTLTPFSNDDWDRYSCSLFAM